MAGRATLRTLELLKFAVQVDDLSTVLPSVTTMDRPADDPRTILEALVRNFERDIAENRQHIGQLLENDRESFYLNAIDLLRSSDDSRGFQHLIATLVSN